MKVFLGGTVNGSKWRNRVKEELIIDYFDPVVDMWNDAAYERELSERRNCDYLLYVLTPRLTGFYAVAEVTDDSYRRPDRTLYCYLADDDGEKFSPEQIEEFETLGKVVAKNGGKWLRNVDEVITFLNTARSAEAKETTDRFDAFISFGRRQSFQFADKLTNRLSDLNYKVFYDVSDIPLIIENEEYIYRNILKADNFIYVISPNAVRSEYCKKELEFAIKYKKRIIPVVHTALAADADKLDDIVARKDTITYAHNDTELEEITLEVQEIMEQEKAYVQQHSNLMFKAIEWEVKGKLPGDLLYGKERKRAVEWLNTPSEYILPLQIHQDFITASKNLSPLMLPLLWLEEKTRSVTRLKLFDKVTLVIALGNPVALADQLRTFLVAQDASIYSSVSLPMWFCFLIIQITLTFVGIKKKDLGLFISMLLSVFISATVITLVAINS